MKKIIFLARGCVHNYCFLPFIYSFSFLLYLLLHLLLLFCKFSVTFWSPLALTEKVYCVSDVAASKWTSLIPNRRSLEWNVMKSESQNIFKAFKEPIGYSSTIRHLTVWNSSLLVHYENNEIVSVFSSNNVEKRVFCWFHPDACSDWTSAGVFWFRLQRNLDTFQLNISFRN